VSLNGTIPQEALDRVDARLRALRPGEGARVEIVLDARREKDGTLRVSADLDLGEKFALVLQLPLDPNGVIPV
jgi:hypothetical protein